MATPNPNPEILKIRDPIVRRKALAAELGQSTTTLWRWTKSGQLPNPVRIGQTVGWPRSVVDAWKVEQGWPAVDHTEAS